MARLAADYSWARPDLAALKQLGYEGIIRYLSWDDSKNLTVDEVQRAHSLGLWVALNWEGHGNWSEFSTGAIGGQAAGAHADQLASRLGAPKAVGIFVSADYQATRDQWPTIGEFFDGFAKASGRPVDFYGQGDLGDWLVANGHARHVWNTNATSWGGVSSRAVIRQQLWADVAGGQIDPNEVVGNPADWAWLPHGVAPTPPAPVHQEDDMPSISLQPGQAGGLIVPKHLKNPVLRVSTNAPSKDSKGKKLGGVAARIVLFDAKGSPKQSSAKNPKDPWHVWVANGCRTIDKLDGIESVDVMLTPDSLGALAVSIDEA